MQWSHTNEGGPYWPGSGKLLGFSFQYQADSMQWSHTNEGGPYWPGSGKLLGFSLLNMHSLHFGVPFYTIFEMTKY